MSETFPLLSSIIPDVSPGLLFLALALAHSFGVYLSSVLSHLQDTSMTKFLKDCSFNLFQVAFAGMLVHSLKVTYGMGRRTLKNVTIKTDKEIAWQYLLQVHVVAAC